MKSTNRPAKNSKYLLVDLSNSFTKFALATREKLLERASLPTPDLTPRRVRAATRDWRYDSVVISSVVPDSTAAIIAGAQCDRTIEVSWKVKLGVTVEFPNPRTIGADRLANAAGVVALHGAPAVVIDFGTAVTFDIVSPDCAYIGGVIAPGLEVMTSYLYERTALLPRIELEEPRCIVGKTTRDAMLAGAVYGYRGLVREILRELKREIAPRGRWNVIATGGYAKLIAARLPEIKQVDPDLTLHGLRVIGNLNF
jgi:type III pantothenate kinase